MKPGGQTGDGGGEVGRVGMCLRGVVVLLGGEDDGEKDSSGSAHWSTCVPLGLAEAFALPWD